MRLSLFSANSERLLRMIELSMMVYRGVGNTVIVAGDFNAHFRCRKTDIRTTGKPCAFGDSFNLVMFNTSMVLTFFTRGHGLIVDITMMSESASDRLLN